MTHAELSDNRLIELILKRDELALETLFVRHAPIVLALAYRILGQLALAEDVVQETFLRVWTKADTYNEKKGQVSSWVFGIAHNVSIDTFRKLKTNPDVSPAAGNPLPVTETDKAAFDALRSAQVRAAISELPQDQRLVIELAYFGGLSRSEIAKATGDPLGTVNTRARLALQKLRAALRESGFETQ